METLTEKFGFRKRNVQTFLLLILSTLAICNFFVVGAKVFISVLTHSKLNFVSGVWVATAKDLADGIFYRPLFSEEIGFGGSRYFPLYFFLHALLIKVFNNPINTGHFLSIISGIFLLVISFFILKKLNLGVIVSLALCSMVLSSNSVQIGIEDIRSDLLPLALNLSGIFLYLIDTGKFKRKDLVAALFFTLAFASKVTAVTGVLSTVIWLFLTKRNSDAIKLVTYTGIGIGILLSGMYVATEGRVYEIFSVCASGGANWVTLLKMPSKFVHNLHSDPICIILIFSALPIAYLVFDKVVQSLIGIFWIISLFITMILFASPGISFNHLVDVVAPSVLLMAISFIFVEKKDKVTSVYLLLCSLLLFSVCFRMYDLKQEILNKGANHSIKNELAKTIEAKDLEVLSEDTLIPILANKSPYMLDGFWINKIIQSDEKAKDFFYRRIKNKEFDKIILLGKAEDYKATSNGLTRNILDYYSLKKIVPGYFIYEPISKN